MTIEIEERMMGIAVHGFAQTLYLSECDQKQLLLWFKNNKPELMREIFCEDCPEHMEPDKD